jgi:hypothetical protein
MIVRPEYAHELKLPIEIIIWDEYELYKACWRRIGIARTWRGFQVLIGKARALANCKWGKYRPFLTTGGPAMGSIGCRQIDG